MPTDQSDGGNFSIEVPASQVTLICVKLIKSKQYSPGESSQSLFPPPEIVLPMSSLWASSLGLGELS